MLTDVLICLNVSKVWSFFFLHQQAVWETCLCVMSAPVSPGRLVFFGFFCVEEVFVSVVTHRSRRYTSLSLSVGSQVL